MEGGTALALLSAAGTVAVALRGEHRYRTVDLPELDIDPHTWDHKDRAMPFTATVRFLKGSREAHDVRVLFRVQNYYWYAESPNLGPHYREVSVRAGFIAGPDDAPELRRWGLPARPFYENDRVSPVGDAGVAVMWKTARRLRWNGHQMKSGGNGTWITVGHTMSGQGAAPWQRWLWRLRRVRLAWPPASP